MPGLLQECFKIRRPVIVSDAQHMFPVKTDVRHQVECRAQSPALIIVQHNEIFQVIIGVADHHVEHHLSVKPLEILPRLRGNMPDYLCQFPVAGIVISVGLEQRLHADHVIAAAGFVDIESFYQQAFTGIQR